MKKLLSLVLALVLALSLSVTAFAASTSGSPIESVDDPSNKQDINVTAGYTKPENVIVHAYYVTVSWEQTGTITYTDAQDTYTWQPGSLTYTKTPATTAASWQCTDAQVAISVENKSDMGVKANCSVTPASGLAIDGSFDNTELTVDSAAPAELTGSGLEKTKTATYTINDVTGSITEAGTIATITVTISAAA